MTIKEHSAIKCIAEDDASKILKQRHIKEWIAIYNKRLQIRRKLQENKK